MFTVYQSACLFPVNSSGLSDQVCPFVKFLGNKHITQASTRAATLRTEGVAYMNARWNSKYISSIRTPFAGLQNKSYSPNLSKSSSE